MEDTSMLIKVCERLSVLETMVAELVRWREWMVLFWITTLGGLGVSIVKLLLIDKRLKNGGEKK